MTIKPIDILTNIGQIHEVARNQQARNDSLIAQMHHLDKESHDKSQIADSHVDESKETQHITTRLDDRKGGAKQKGAGKKESEKKEKEDQTVTEVVQEGNLGRFIDVKK